MGEVWRAFDTETKRVVAAKLLPAVIFGDEFALLGWVFALPRWASGEFNPDRGLCT